MHPFPHTHTHTPTQTISCHFWLSLFVSFAFPPLFGALSSSIKIPVISSVSFSRDCLIRSSFRSHKWIPLDDIGGWTYCVFFRSNQPTIFLFTSFPSFLACLHSPSNFNFKLTLTVQSPTTLVKILDSFAVALALVYGEENGRNMTSRLTVEDGAHSRKPSSHLQTKWFVWKPKKKAGDKL